MIRAGTNRFRQPLRRRASDPYCIDPHDGARLPVHRTGVGETMPRFTGRPTSSAWPVSAYLGAVPGVHCLGGIQIQKPWFDPAAPPPTLGGIQIQQPFYGGAEPSVVVDGVEAYFAPEGVWMRGLGSTAAPQFTGRPTSSAWPISTYLGANPWHMQQQAGMGQAAAIISASVTALATIGTMWMQWDAQNRASIQMKHEEERAAARALEQQQAAAAAALQQQQALEAAIAAGQVVVGPDGTLHQANGGGAGPADDGTGGKGFQIGLVLLPILAGVLLSGMGRRRAA